MQSFLRGRNLDFSMQVVGLDNFKVDIAEEPDSRIAADSKVRMAAAGEDPRLHFTVVQARDHGHIEGHLAFDAFDDPNQLAARALPAAGAHGKEVGDACDVAAHPVGGDQHQRLVHVLPADLGFAFRGDDEVAALLPIQHAAETTV